MNTDVLSVFIFWLWLLVMPSLAVFIDGVAGIRAQDIKYQFGGVTEGDFRVLVPIWGSASYLINDLRRYGDRVTLVTTGDETPAFYTKLHRIASEHGARIFMDRPTGRHKQGNKRATSGTTRDRLIRNVLAEVTEPYVIPLDAVHLIERQQVPVTGALVFRAAACKRVPLMERSPAQAIVTNVTGTANVTVAAAHNNVWRLVNISADKAADPVSLLEQTKRLAEVMVLRNAGPAMQVASVRFGNVYGSRGSLIETLDYQIRHHLPVTITAPGMTRSFMTIPQAAGLVIPAAVLADGTSMFILDMGKALPDHRSGAPLCRSDRWARPGHHLHGAEARRETGRAAGRRNRNSPQTRHPQILAVHGWDGASASSIKAVRGAARLDNKPAALRAELSALTSHAPVKA